MTTDLMSTLTSKGYTVAGEPSDGPIQGAMMLADDLDRLMEASLRNGGELLRFFGNDDATSINVTYAPNDKGGLAKFFVLVWPTRATEQLVSILEKEA